MILFLRLVAQMAASFAGGYLANDVVDIVTANQAQKKLASPGQPVPQIPLTNVFQRWLERQFIMKFLIVLALAVGTTIVFMTAAKRKKLFR